MIPSMQIFKCKDFCNCTSNFSMIVEKFYNKSVWRERICLGATGSSLFHDCTFCKYKFRKVTLHCGIMKINSGKDSFRDKLWLFSRGY